MQPGMRRTVIYHGVRSAKRMHLKNGAARKHQDHCGEGEGVEVCGKKGRPTRFGLSPSALEREKRRQRRRRRTGKASRTVGTTRLLCYCLWESPRAHLKLSWMVWTSLSSTWWMRHMKLRCSGRMAEGGLEGSASVKIRLQLVGKEIGCTVICRGSCCLRKACGLRQSCLRRPRPPRTPSP